MDSYHQDPNQADFNNFHPFGGPSYESIFNSWDFSQMPPPYPQRQPNLPPSSPTPVNPVPPTKELNALNLKPSPPPCPLCCGQRWNFTLYFHNRALFPTPPHELRPLVERSYVLKDVLQSLLVTYAVRGIGRQDEDEDEGELKKEAEIQIRAWEANLEELVRRVLDRGAREGGEEVAKALEHVRTWTAEMLRKLRGFVASLEGRAMCSSDSKELVVEFRRCWESVWIAISNSRGHVGFDTNIMGVSA